VPAALSGRRLPDSATLAWGSRPDGWVDGVVSIPSPHHDERPPPASIDLLVVHYISLPPGRFSGDAIERLFMGTLDHAAHPYFAALTGLRVSAHFLIRRRGEVRQFVATDRRAWHAGVSQFQGRERCNDFSIGIELEGDGEHPFTQAQYRRLAALTRLLCERHPLRWLAGHSDIAPGRKEDPGPTFDWGRYLSDLEGTRLSRPF